MGASCGRHAAGKLKKRVQSMVFDGKTKRLYWTSRNNNIYTTDVPSSTQTLKDIQLVCCSDSAGQPRADNDAAKQSSLETLGFIC